MRELPFVHGGRLLECNGGPLDGELVFLIGGNSQVDVWHYNDPKRTICAGVGYKPFSENYLGSYDMDGNWHGWSPAAKT